MTTINERRYKNPRSINCDRERLSDIANVANLSILKESALGFSPSEPWRRYNYLDVVHSVQPPIDDNDDLVESTLALVEYIYPSINAQTNSLTVMRGLIAIVEYNSEIWDECKGKGKNETAAISMGWKPYTRSAFMELLIRADPAVWDPMFGTNSRVYNTFEDTSKHEVEQDNTPMPTRPVIPPQPHGTVVIYENTNRSPVITSPDPSPEPDDTIIPPSAPHAEEVDYSGVDGSQYNLCEFPKGRWGTFIEDDGTSFISRVVSSNRSTSSLRNWVATALAGGNNAAVADIKRDDVITITPYLLLAQVLGISSYRFWVARAASKAATKVGVSCVASMFSPLATLAVCNLALVGYLAKRYVDAQFTTAPVLPMGVAQAVPLNGPPADRVVDPELAKSTVVMMQIPEYQVLSDTDSSFVSAFVLLSRRMPDLVDSNGTRFYFKATGKTLAMPSTMLDEVSFFIDHPEPTVANYQLANIQVAKYLKKVQNLTPSQEHDSRVSGAASIYMYQKKRLYDSNPAVKACHDRMLYPAISLKNASFLLGCSVVLLATQMLLLKKSIRRADTCGDATTTIINVARDVGNKTVDAKHRINATVTQVGNKLKTELQSAKLDHPPQITTIEGGYVVAEARNESNTVQRLLGFNPISWLWSKLPHYRSHTIKTDITDASPLEREETAIWTCHVAPCIEEALRAKYGWKFTILICIIETLRYGSPITVPLHVTCQVLHLLSPGFIGYSAAYTIHSLWNCIAIFTSVGEAPTASSPMLWGKFKKYTPDKMDIPRVNLFKIGAVVHPPLFERVSQSKEHMKQYCVGIASSDYRPSYLLPSPDNDVQALDARVLAATPIPDAVLLRDFTRWFKGNVWKIFPKLKHRVGFEPPPFSQYIANTNASPGVKRLLVETRNKLELSGVNEQSRLSSDMLRDFGTKSSFLKVENNCYRSKFGLKVKPGRLIQGSRPDYLCLVGPWIQKLQEYIKRDLNGNNFMCFTSGVSTHKAASLLMSLNGTLLENDVSAWDSSLNIAFADLETWFVNKMGAPPAVVDLIRNNRIKRGRTFFGYRYKVPGTRASGEPFTSLFNSVWNLVIHLYIYCRTQGRTVDQSRLEIRGLFQGDDGALNIPCHVVIDWVAWFLRFGFNSKAVYRSKATDLEFCSMRLYPVLEGWCFGPKIGKVMSKLGYFVSPPMNTRPEVLLRGVCLGLLPNCAFLKPLRVVIDRLLQLTCRAADVTLPTRREQWQMSFSECHEIPATLFAIHEHYGVGDYLLDELHRELQVELGNDCSKNVYNYICDTDTAGPQFYMH